LYFDAVVLPLSYTLEASSSAGEPYTKGIAKVFAVALPTTSAEKRCSGKNPGARLPVTQLHGADSSVDLSNPMKLTGNKKI